MRTVTEPTSNYYYFLFYENVTELERIDIDERIR